MLVGWWQGLIMMLSLAGTDGSHFCGGTLVASRYVVSAVTVDTNHEEYQVSGQEG